MTDRALAISMSLGDWLIVDAVMDNTGQNAIDAYDEALAERARSIRHIGWDVTGPIIRPISEAGNWPPSEEVRSEPVQVTLSTPNWRFIVEHLQHSSNLDDAIDQPDEAALTRTIADRITEQLTAPRTPA